MNSYKLDNKDQDLTFLAGNPVTGSVMFRKREFNPEVVMVGERIVILLSNGKKYLGKVTGFTCESKGQLIEGKIEITRA